MKIFISADIEGVSGICDWDEANPAKPESRFFQEQMTQEVKAACDGAIRSGAKEIVVKDAHWTGRNINPQSLPECVSVLRGWSGHPYSMMDGLDDSFDAVLYVGYHSRAGSNGNPLAHTMSSSIVREMRINGVPASEFLMNSYTAAMLGVPVVFLSGDSGLCGEVAEYSPNIETFASLRGRGSSTLSVHPSACLSGIEKAVSLALAQDLSAIKQDLPEDFSVEIDFMQHKFAYNASFYPNCEAIGSNTIRYRSADYFDILKMIKFTVRG